MITAISTPALAIFFALATEVSSFAPPPQVRRPALTGLWGKKVFIDGEVGTTGLQVRDRLADREDLEIISAPFELRKDEATRKRLINEADAVILCLPDAASVNAVGLLEPDNDRTVMIDASTAFRVDEDWAYGFPELSKEQYETIKKSKRISNPGCCEFLRAMGSRLILPAAILLSCSSASCTRGLPAQRSPPVLFQICRKLFVRIAAPQTPPDLSASLAPSWTLG